MTEARAHILLVDDDEAKRYLMGTWLRRGGHTVIEAGTGKEALEKAGSAELVLLDVNLPDMLGYDVCRQIKADPATAAIPGAWSGEQMRPSSRRPGASATASPRP